MDQEQLQQEIEEHPDQIEAIEPEASDVDFNHVRGLMYTLVTICVFCASILLGPDEQILPADGNLSIPIFDLEIKKGNFLYIGPVIIICVSMYTYLFLLKILARVKAGRESSDQYIFTMNHPAAQIATYCIFFWLPALILFSFAYKTLPRPESANLIGISLIFLISIVAIQLLLRFYRFSFLNIIAVSMFCVTLVLYGFVGDGWLNVVRLKLHALSSMTLENAKLAKRDLRDVDIRNATATSIILSGADLRNAVIKEADLKHANLKDAKLLYAELECTDLRHANFDKADLSNAKFIGTNLSEATFRGATLERVSFYAKAENACRKSGNRTNLVQTNFEGADLSHANLSDTGASKSILNGANLFRAKIIDARFNASSFVEYEGEKSNLTAADLRCSSFGSASMVGANLRRAELGGIDLTNAKLNSVELTEANLDSLHCSTHCIELYISNENCAGKNVRGDLELDCPCKPDEEGLRASNLVDANLTFANLEGSSFKGANLTNADLQGAKLRDADLTDATIVGANIFLADLTSVTGLTCPKLKTAKYWKASIRDSDLECNQEVIDLEGWDAEDKQKLADLHSTLEAFNRLSRTPEGKEIFQLMEGALMSNVDLSRLDLNDIWLNNAKLNDATLTGIKFKGARLKNADLKRSRLEGADLSRAILDGADMQNTILQNANLEGARLKDTILREADLKGANLNDVKGLTCEQLESADSWQQSYRDSALQLECGGESPQGAYKKTGISR